MQIRKAKMGELEVLMEKYESARSFMAANGNPQQWGDYYPPKALIETDIGEGACYVCQEGEQIVGVFYYKKETDPTYTRIYEGQWLSDAPYGVVHRITSDGSVKGTASFCLNWALEQCRNLKIDTHRDNLVMQNLLQKNGFSYCGIIRIEDGSERMAYQKILG